MLGLAAAIALAQMPPAAAAEDATLVAARPIRAMTLIGPADVTLLPGATPGALSDPEAAIGREARVMLYPGRPIRPGDVGPPALVERNGRVTLRYARGGLEIATEGRALDRAGLGETVRVMNLDSRIVVSGTVAGPGLVEVSR
ncbi:MAG: flagella basal body P-ring formation protein FlgA [Alphaproteobacteria bacterium]|nr:MAG: flagella basal body P-ring formation protein FlgA [Alphaproteobacteria bacterium]